MKSEDNGTSLNQLFWNQQEVWSGRGDLNARPPAPKAGALPGCATPRRFAGIEETEVFKAKLRNQLRPQPYVPILAKNHC